MERTIMYDDERRRHPRVATPELTYVLVDKEGRHLMESEGRTLNVSESGLCLETAVFIESDQHLLLAIAFRDVLVEVLCRVVHCRQGQAGRYEAGVEVLDTEGAFGDAVRGFMEYFREQRSANS